QSIGAGQFPRRSVGGGFDPVRCVDRLLEPVCGPSGRWLGASVDISQPLLHVFTASSRRPSRGFCSAVNGCASATHPTLQYRRPSPSALCVITGVSGFIGPPQTQLRTSLVITSQRKPTPPGKEER